MKATTKGQGMAAKIEPSTGETIATFWIKECKGSEAIEPLNGTYEIKGSLKTTTIEGATASYTEVDTTTQNTLKSADRMRHRRHDNTERKSQRHRALHGDQRDNNIGVWR